MNRQHGDEAGPAQAKRSVRTMVNWRSEST